MSSNSNEGVMNMKKFLGLMIAVLFSSQAMAAQYEIYVTGSTHVSPAQAGLTAMVQKGIFIDSAAKLLRFELSPTCAAGAMCPQFIRTIDLKLTQITARNGQVVTARAEGELDLNNK